MNVIRSTPTPYEGQLAATTYSFLSMSGAPLPSNISLASAAGGRKIELRNQTNSEWFVPTYDRNTAAEISVSVTVGIDAVRFTGAIGDYWSIS